MQPSRLKRWGRCALWLVFCVFLGLVCSSPKGLAATVRLTDADKGGAVHLKAGDTLELRLYSNPSTGFMWYLEKESTPLLKLTHQTQTEPTQSGVGRPIFQVFLFEAKRPGEGVLRMHYVRSWEKPMPDERKFDLHVAIE